MRQVAIRLLVLVGLATGFAATADTTRGVSLDAAAAERFAALALKCLHDEYPSHLSHTMDSAADARPPHELTPAFYGCYDWHSDVHGHWLLVRAALPAVTGEHYEGGHWLGTFAVYLTTGAGLSN